MPNTDFDPRIHGFHFSNNDIRWSFGPISSTMLCGGMTYASLDYYYHRIAIPPQNTPPAEGTPLHGYIYMRQEDAHRYALPRLSQTLPERGNRAFGDGVRASGQFGRIMRAVTARRPVPILMVSNRSALSTGSHWTLAIGYEKANHGTYGANACSKIYLYDNARPDEVCELVPDFAQGNFRHVQSGSRYRTIFANDAYGAVHPNSAVRPPSAAGLMPSLMGGMSPPPGMNF